MAMELLVDIRDELEGDFNHPIIGYTILALSGGLAVLTAGELLMALEMPTSVVFTGIIIAAGVVPTVTAYILHKTGF